MQDSNPANFSTLVTQLRSRGHADHDQQRSSTALVVGCLPIAQLPERRRVLRCAQHHTALAAGHEVIGHACETGAHKRLRSGSPRLADRRPAQSSSAGVESRSSSEPFSSGRSGSPRSSSACSDDLAVAAVASLPSVFCQPSRAVRAQRAPATSPISSSGSLARLLTTSPSSSLISRTP